MTMMITIMEIQIPRDAKTKNEKHCYKSTL